MPPSGSKNIPPRDNRSNTPSVAIFLMNPTTKELWKVPVCPFAPPQVEEAEGDEEEEVYVKYGFGYDSSTDDYKIVSIAFWHPHSLLHYFTETFDYQEHDHTVWGIILGAPINQSLHWLSRQFEIVGFNLANEEFNEMKCPDSDARYTTSFFSTMVDVGGVFMRNNEVGFECCVMEGYGVGESWTRVLIHGVEKDRVLLPAACMLQGRNREIVFQEKEGGVVVYNIYNL